MNLPNSDLYGMVTVFSRRFQRYPKSVLAHELALATLLPLAERGLSRDELEFVAKNLDISMEQLKALEGRTGLNNETEQHHD